MLQSLSLACESFVYGFFVKISIKKLVGWYTGLLVEQALNVLIGNILRKRICEFRACVKTL